MCGYTIYWGYWESEHMRLIEWAQGKGRPDFIIGGVRSPYLLRWYLIPRNPVFNVYLHKFMRSDDDRALHDHPWPNASFLLLGSYIEHRILAGGVHSRRVLRAGQWRIRWLGRVAHRIELYDGPCWTLFITGPRYRKWGFHCAEKGWIPWQRFTASDNSGKTGPGCDG